MAKDPQTPIDEEMERAEHEIESQPEPLEGQLDEDEAAPASDATVDAEEAANPEAEVLAARVEELEQALTEAKEQSLRAAAEAQNVRRRSEQDVDKARKFALEKFV
ncbi:MAG: nucleotide exchange factor GrpE, partial [Halomonas sp.]|nr:nucleotide exchange factor GrpE [Halomonas sp.]